MKYKVKIVEATSPYDLETKINEAIKSSEFKGYEVLDVRTEVTQMPGAKVSRGGMFYLSSILFRKTDT
ncbi:MAG: hypothetical protein ABH871_03665 [Pseudomonadota bacterium]